ncbi:MAG: pyridoxal-dependent decarboxylase [Methylococcaceae bacterium]|nr:pyridoxal-dependent decarboxylase [Methylococcaceae bacterium]
MNVKHNQWRHYTDVLDTLKTCFPSPVSDPIMDGYFVHTISRFLDQIDELKSTLPILGKERKPFYEGNLHAGIPEEMSTIEQLTGFIADYCEGMTIWSHPNAQANVTPPATISSITAFVAAAIYNPNLVWDEYSARFAEAEVRAIAMLSDLVGYDPEQSGGLFTFGGTGTILYGCKLAIERLSGGKTMEQGLREEVKIVCSSASHYTRLNVAAWLGVGTRNVVTIAPTSENEISLIELENYLRVAFEHGDRVAAIIATLGTTDAFGLDDLAAIVHLRDRLVEEYGLDYKPHVHADAVIGWAWAVFRDYDFDLNPLGFHSRTIRSLRDSLQKISALSLADSIGVDFHKTGYVPYISSAILVKDRQHLTLLSRASEQMPYLYQFGNYHPGIYTLECSRSGASALAALANMQLFGKQGYRVLIGHSVEMAEMLRERLERHPFIKVLNDYNYGPVTLFRVYPPGMNAHDAWLKEIHEPDYCETVNALNGYNRRLFDHIHAQVMRGEGVLLSWTDHYQTARSGCGLSALKSFVMSPWTDLNSVETVVRQLLEAREKISS